MVKLVQCSCVSEYQDKVYGKNVRLHNHMKKDDGWRCTICGKEKSRDAK